MGRTRSKMDEKPTIKQRTMTWKEACWIDWKGRKILIHTMQDKWLNNIKRKCKTHPRINLIREEIKRRRTNRKQ